jgi:N-hydroxyarylamine O-acetyltransferase
LSIDVDAYCRRIGYDGERVPTLAALRALHALHPRSIPFENFDPLLTRPVKLDIDSLNAKMVHGGRGGYCFEQNMLLAHALEAFGFRIKKLAGRVRWGIPTGIVLPRVHFFLIVMAEGEDYLADVGFGANTLTAPLLLRARDEQSTSHEPFRLVEEGDNIVLRAKIRGEWSDLYAFDMVEQLLADLECGNWYTSTHPGLRFVNELIVTRVEPDGRHALRNNELARHRLGGATERRTLRSVSEMRATLTNIFGLKLPDGADAVLARFAPQGD